MNRIFSPVGEGWPEFPKRSFGKLDQVEPLDPARSGEAVFCIDVVDAQWTEFGRGGFLDLSFPAIFLHIFFWNYWSRLFAGIVPAFDPYEEAPIYRIEVSCNSGDQWFKEFSTLGEDEWIELELDYSGTFEVQVYGSLLGAPAQAHLKRVTRGIPQSPALNAVFSPSSWPLATPAQLTAALSGLPALESMIGLDVGQGASSGLADANEDIHLYFDLGGGVYRNAKTRPKPLQFCWRVDAPIILSHWDSDHWSGEVTDPKAAGRTWIAPLQSMTKKHIAFANKILRGGGSLLLWPPSLSSIFVPVSGGSQHLDVRKCTGAATDRNRCGLAAVVKDVASGNHWLLTGDAGYDEVGGVPTQAVAVIVPHHGADMGASSDRSAPPCPSGYARLFYSFGPNNRHGRTSIQHPTPAGMAAHPGWNHGTWTTTSAPGHSIAGGEVLASAHHPVSHLDGVAMGWNRAPLTPLANFTCASSGRSSICICSHEILRS